MSEAYKWLNTLPASVREEMKSMEQVVSLYLRAKRLGGAIPSKEELDNFKPATTTYQENKSQEFQKTLKSLRTELDHFDFAQQTQTQMQTHTTYTQAQTHNTISQAAAAGAAIPQQLPPIPQPVSAPQMQAPPTHQSQGPQYQAHTQAPAQAQTAARADHLDAKSRQIVNEIKEALNLSSDAEVIRMSLVLARKSLQNLL